MFKLHPASRKALDEFASTLSDSQGERLRRAVERVCADPSGRREPRHRYTRPFRNARRYVAGLERSQAVWEFKTNHCRGLFVSDSELRLIVFLPVSGRRFVRPEDCPWPH